MREVLNMEGFCSGDHQEFEKVIIRYANELYYFLLKRGVDSQAAQDIVFMAFQKIYTYRESYRTQEVLRSALYTTVKHLCMNHLRSEEQRKWREATFQSSIASEDNYDSFNDEIEADILRRRLRKAVDKLPRTCREVFILHYYEGLSNEAIAARLNISKHNVSSQLYKARQQLTELLKK